MPLSYDHELNIHSLNDTAELYAYINDRNGLPIPQEDIASVTFEIEKPDKTRVGPTAGTVTDDGEARFLFSDTDTVGEYLVVAKFVLAGGVSRSVRSDFEVVDPFNPPAPEPMDYLVESVWLKFEDCFDSELGGPWLRDETKRYFSRDKIPAFVADALTAINVAQPNTTATIDTFAKPVNGQPNPDLPILSQGVMLSVIRHLMRSYTEQPAVQGGQVVYEDRRDYLQRWGTIFQIEMQTFDKLVALWKRQFIGWGHGKVLVDSKAGRYWGMPRVWGVRGHRGW